MVGDVSRFPDAATLLVRAWADGYHDGANAACNAPQIELSSITRKVALQKLAEPRPEAIERVDDGENTTI